MPSTGLAVFDRTLHATNEWLNGIEAELGADDKHRAYSALRATLHAVRDLLPVEEAVQFSAEMPILIRGMYFEGWKPGQDRERHRRVEDFIDHVRYEIQNGDSDEEVIKAVEAVFKVLLRKISAGEVIDVQRLLPKHVRELWP